MAPRTCPNCTQALHADDAYCSRCGQAVIGKEDLRGFLDQFLGDYFTYDSKLIRSLVPLLVRPGFLTTEYMAGRRARYIPPLRMFIFLSVVFFLVFGWTVPRSDDTSLAEALEDRLFWDHFFTSVLPKLFFLFLPLFALFTHLFYRDRPPSFIKTFIFSAHFHAFVFLAFTVYGLISRTLLNLGLVEVNTILILIFLLYVVVYLWVALHRVHPRPLARHFVKFLALSLLYTVTLATSAVLLAWLLL